MCIRDSLYVALRLLDGTTVASARFYSVLLGSMAVPLMAAVGRRAAPDGWGDRVGIVTAAIVAIHPAIWVGDSMLNNETVLVVVLPLFLLACYRALDMPGRNTSVTLAITFVLVVLTRVELAGLGVFVLPFVWLRASPDWRTRLHSALAFGMTAVVPVSYTHLDVYKRQVAASSSSPSSASTCASAICMHWTPTSCISRRRHG